MFSFKTATKEINLSNSLSRLLLRSCEVSWGELKKLGEDFAGRKAIDPL